MGIMANYVGLKNDRLQGDGDEQRLPTWEAVERRLIKSSVKYNLAMEQQQQEWEQEEEEQAHELPFIITIMDSSMFNLKLRISINFPVPRCCTEMETQMKSQRQRRSSRWRWRWRERWTRSWRREQGAGTPDVYSVFVCGDCAKS